MGKKLSASQAAKKVGKSVPTISRAIKSGKLSAEPNPRGGWLIDPSELARVWGETPVTGNRKGDTLQRETDVKPSDVRVLEVELKAKSDMIARLEAEIEDVKVERDDWKEQAKTLLISNQDRHQEAPQEARRGFLGIFRTRA